jgi:hypothetical protein
MGELGDLMPRTLVEVYENRPVKETTNLYNKPAKV